MVVPDQAYIAGHDNWYARRTGSGLLYVLRAPRSVTDNQGFTKVLGERLILEGWTWSFRGLLAGSSIALAWTVDPLGTPAVTIFWSESAGAANGIMAGTVSPTKIAGGASASAAIRPDALQLVGNNAQNLEFACWGRIDSAEHSRWHAYDGAPVSS